MRIAIVLTIALATGTCQHPIHADIGIPPEALPPIGRCAGPSGQLRVVTMNAGLASGVVDMANARTPDFARDIAQFRDADVLCLQEVWKEDAVSAVQKSLGLPPDHIYRVDTRGRNEEPGRFTCSASQIAKVMSCVKDTCKYDEAEHQTICALQELRKCPLTLSSLRYFGGLPCLNCLAASVGKPIDEIARACISKKGVSHVYDGENGVILASKWPLRNRSYIELPASAVNKVVLFATIDIPGRGPMEVACTHLTSPEKDIPTTNPRFKTWDQEVAEQFRLTAAALKARAGNRPALLVGDLNTGIDFQKDGRVTHEPVWDDILAEGFGDPASRVRPPMCTMCPENVLRHAGSSRVIDHVLTLDPKNWKPFEPICGRQLLTGRRMYERANGSRVELEVSDHYGVEIDFSGSEIHH